MEKVDFYAVGVLFQFTPLREGRLIQLAGTGDSEHFNSRPCVRGDLLRRFR